MKYRIFYCFLWIITVISCKETQKDTSKSEQIRPEITMDKTLQNGIVTKISTKDFESTYDSLIEIISNNPNLKIIAELDHQSNAASVDLSLRPTRIVLFGNPKLGTPLMQNSQTTGLDLPQKILVWQAEDKQVNISYNDPLYLRQRHGISGDEKTLTKISGALNKITDLAAGL